MSNYKEINWDIIRADYVMGVDYPSYDELSKKHKVSKPLIIAKANDLEDAMNRGKTWMQQREVFVKKKQTIQEDVATQEAKTATKTFIKVLNNVGLKAFKLIDNELNYLLSEQQKAIDKKEYFPIRKYVKIGDIAKIAEVLHKLSGAESSRDMLIKLQLVDGATHGGTINLQDLTEEQLKQLNEQVKYGATKQIIEQEETEEAEYQEVKKDV